MRKRSLPRWFAALLVVPMIGCGNADPAPTTMAAPASEQPVPGQQAAAPMATSDKVSAAGAAGGNISLRIAGAETGTGTAGVTACVIDFEVHNQGTEAIKFLAAFWRPVVVPGNVTAASAVEARGDQRLYAGKVAGGETKNRRGKVDGVACDQISGLRLWDVTCGLESRADCKGQVDVSNDSQLALNPGA